MMQGSLSVDSENIFPIIKKWLYTEQDIFFRELISNASDAIVKLRKLIEMGNADIHDYHPRIDIRINREEGTIRFIDNGIGMTMDEVEQYINQIAFSGATDFIERYRGQTDEEQIIGHFGLGFYSAFMVSNLVMISTRSYQTGAVPVFWSCDSSMKYEMSEGIKTGIGTEITLHIGETSKYLNVRVVRDTIRKYFEFLPIEIYLTEDGELEENRPEESRMVNVQINDTHPLWVRKPEECTKEEYVKFYKSAFRDLNDPAYWIHLYDEDLGIRGIVYLKSEETMTRMVDGLIKLYSNQVFVADNAKEVIPDFLLLQYGVIDCRDLPLMVSRSNLHEDERIGKIERYITEQIAQRLYGLFSCERAQYEALWPSLNPFIKYSCLKNKLFSSYVNKFVIFEQLDGSYVTLKEHLDEIRDTHPNRIYYVSDDIQQAQYINIYKEAGIRALMMTHVIDSPYIRREEMQYNLKNKEEGDILRFDRIDAAFCDALQDTTVMITDEEKEKWLSALKRQFRQHVKGFDMDIRVEWLLCKNTPAIIMVDEEERRIMETIDLYGAQGMDVSGFKEQKGSFILNAENEMVRSLMQGMDTEKAFLICNQLYDLGRLSNETLEMTDMVSFIERTNRLLQMATIGE